MNKFLFSLLQILMKGVLKIEYSMFDFRCSNNLFVNNLTQDFFQVLVKMMRSIVFKDKFSHHIHNLSRMSYLSMRYGY